MLIMRALCLITVKPGKVDAVIQLLKKKRKVVKDVMVVTGRADISVIMQGKMDEINNMVIDFKKIKEIMNAVTIPVMAKSRIGHVAEAQILEALGVDMVDESEG